VAASATEVTERFIADLHRLWQEHGREVLGRLKNERRMFIFR
jgi:hypothetical protein